MGFAPGKPYFIGVGIQKIKEACRRSALAGIEGVLIQGEQPNDYVTPELNYLALETFSLNPEASTEEFATGKLAPLYGSEDAALKLLQIANSIEGDQENVILLKENLRLAKEAAESVN